MTKPKSEEEIEEDLVCRAYFKVPLQDELEAMSDIQLAERELKIDGKVAEIMIRNEWRRRDKLEQHELNREIIKQQHHFNLEIAKLQNKKSFKTALFSACIGFVGAIVGATLTVSGSKMVTKEEVLHQQDKQKITADTPSNTQAKRLTNNQGLTQIAEKKTKVVSSQSPKIKEQ
ncbi:MAG: hypothetical protein R6W72_04720 [Desulfurivibrionaceae bacterium]